MDAERYDRAGPGYPGALVEAIVEVVTFQALREHLRCKEIWITGAASVQP